MNEKRTTLGERLKSGRGRKSLKQHQVANLLGVTPQAISQWERDKTTPELHHISALAEIYNLSLRWLITGQSYSMRQKLRDKTILLDLSILGPEIYHVPIHLSKKLKNWETEDVPFKKPEVLGQVLHTHSRVGPHAFALFVQDDRMGPVFRFGDLVIVDPEVAPSSGDPVVAVCKNQSDALIGYYTLEKDASTGGIIVQLRQSDPNRGEIVTIGNDPPGRIVGTIMEHRSFPKG